MHFLALDLGTTHCKAAVVSADGRIIALSQQPTPTVQSAQGAYYHPEQFWQTAASVMRAAVDQAGVSVNALGISSMAETGLLIDAGSKHPCSVVLPWFNTSGHRELKCWFGDDDTEARFCVTGLRPSPKYGLAKVLHLKGQGVKLEGKVWLSASDYIALRLTGSVATDPTLAARTYAYSLPADDWDYDVMERLGLPPGLFPPVLPSGSPVGVCRGQGVPASLADVPVSICGHDHVVATLAAGTSAAGQVLNSMGTAEVLLGVQEKVGIDEAKYGSGLSFGPHVLPGLMSWMGGLSASGGSVEWIRSIMSDSKLSYDEIKGLLAVASPGPSGIIYYPHLSGSGAPLPDPDARGALLGLRRSHKRGDILKAIFEGTCMAMEFMRQEAAKATGIDLNDITVVGGGARNRDWVQMKANIFGCHLNVLKIQEATLVGAALLAGWRCGLVTMNAIRTAAVRREREVVTPDMQLHEAYQWFFREGYLAVQRSVREYDHKLAGRDGLEH